MIADNQNYLLKLDDYAIALFLKLPASKVAFLQSLLETYEGLGTVRTLDVKNSLIAIITTKEQLTICEQLLSEIKPLVSWAYANEIDAEKKLGFLQTESTESTF